MPIHFNHTILSARDSKASADFLADMLGLPAPRRWGPFYMVTTDNDANLDYMDTEDAEFEAIFNRIRERNLRYWADPGQRKPGETNDHDSGRGIYFEDPNGHLVEIITRPYGSGGWNP
ncbi:VOC family protein [Rhizobium laguerreae]|uniref:VOC family protein n=1 Tax=Rhizobium laguerreae TaxID=1076926 RepID=UPI001C8FA9C8|nr:VOC family protein [Rhizobium laguerreae]MBY3151894.1 VOC family protein [Rhizobium laguerreae]